MSTLLYNKLGDNFDEHSGQLSSYTDGNLVPLGSPKHYNLRSFHSTDIAVPQTMLDLSYWNVGYYTGTTMDALSQRRSITGQTFRRHTQDDYSIAVGGLGAATYMTQAQMDEIAQFNLDFATVSSGNEDWPATDSNVTVGVDSAYGYSNTIRVALTSGVTETVPSYYVDDILTDFQDDTYYIELILRAFPAQAASAHLDLTNSFIDFSSDQTFASSVTDSISFSQSLTSLNAGGDLTFRINRDLLVKADLSNLRAIQFRLLATGGSMTFIAQEMRVVPSTWESEMFAAGIDTKRGTLSRTIYSSMTGVENTIGTLLFEGTRPEDVTVFSKFYSGNPQSTSNNFKLFLRYTDANNFIKVSILSSNTQTQYTFTEVVNGSTYNIYSSTQAELLPETDYYIEVKLAQGSLSLAVDNVDGNFLGSPIFSSGDQPVSEIGRGYVGYSFEPYTYDFVVDFVNSTEADFVRFESSVFSSRTPVFASTLEGYNSPPINLLQEMGFYAMGDATISTSTIGQPSPSTQIARTGTQWLGGIQSDSPISLGDPSQVTIEGDLYPVGSVSGEYRLVLVDTYGSVGWIGLIQNLLPNQWNHFEIPVSFDLLPVSFIVYLQQTGLNASTFSVDNLAINHQTIAWEASADNGQHWQPFNTSINSTYTGVRFLYPGSDLQVRATAKSDKAWIEGYELVPHYSYGRNQVSTLPSTSTTALVRVSGNNHVTTYHSQDVRINGPLTISEESSARITGQLTSSSHNDTRITGQ